LDSIDRQWWVDSSIKSELIKAKLAQLLIFDHIEPHNATCFYTIGSKKGKGLKNN